MNTAELLKSLSQEQSTALLNLRDEINASNAVAMGELVAIKADELATLKQQIEDKDTAHEAVVARMSDEKAQTDILVTKAKDVIDDPDVSNDDTVLQLKAMIEAQSLPGKVAALRAKIEAEQEQLAADKDALNQLTDG